MKTAFLAQLFCRLFRNPVISGVLVLTISAAPAHAFWELIAGGMITHFVGKGLINEAKDAVDQTIKDADHRVQDRINQMGDRADASIKLAGQELRNNLATAQNILNEAIDKASGKAEDIRRQVFDDLARERRAFFADLDKQQAVFFARAEIVSQGVLNHEDEILNRTMRFGALELAQAREDLVNLRLVPGVGHHEYRLQRLLGQAQTYKLSGQYEFKAIGYGMGSGYKVAIKLKERPIPIQNQLEGLHVRTFDVPVQWLNDSFQDVKPSPVSLQFNSRELGTLNTRVILLPKFPVKYKLTAKTAGGEDLQLHVTKTAPEFFDAEESQIRKGRSPGPELEQSIRVRLGRLIQVMEDWLPYGTTEVDLPEQCLSYRFEVTWFNGDRAILSPSNPTALGVSVAPELPKSLRIDVKMPQVIGPGS
jgi:vacuolar-type H+-ATPase subunit H